MKHAFSHLWRLALSLCLGLLASLLTLSVERPVFSHGGGTPRLTSVPTGPYFLYAWSEPDPWRVGEVHLSLAVTKPNPDTNSNQIELPVTDVDITVTFTHMSDNTVDASVDTSVEPIVVPAVRQAFLGDFYYEADPTLPVEGNWQITIDVSGPEGSGSAEFTLEALPPRALNWTLIWSAGGVVVVILALIAIWSRSQQPSQPVQRPHRGERRVQRSSQGATERKAAVRKEV
jgi:hypothetical protein